jgi:hypothetical protein
MQSSEGLQAQKIYLNTPLGLALQDTIQQMGFNKEV